MCILARDEESNFLTVKSGIHKGSDIWGIINLLPLTVNDMLVTPATSGSKTNGFHAICG